MHRDLHFDINPHVVKQLGEELVTDEITALMELVKNAYDADANYVYVEIDTVNSYEDKSIFFPNHSGYIIVEDDGIGMNLDIIKNSWLVISSSKKRDLKSHKYRTDKNRAPLGDKGLGRLSTQRLADFCEIYTGQNSENHQIHVSFNWMDFEKSAILSEVPVYFELSTIRKRGTKLILSNIKDKEVWKGKNLETFKGQISQMISPYLNNKPFEVFLKINGQNIDLTEENIALRDLALSRFQFKVKNNTLSIHGKIRPEKLMGKKIDEYYQFISPDRGKKFLKFLQSKKNDFNLSSIDDGSFFLSFNKTINIYPDIPQLEIYKGSVAYPGPFEGEINDFSFDRWISDEEKFKSAFDSFSNYRSFAEQQIGIKLYRNGFAVKPFGLDGNDWLRLREAQTSGSSHYLLRPANIIGFFAIDEYENEFLRDKTDREGLVSNPYSRNFETMSFFIRDEINRFLNFVRRKYNEYLFEFIQENKKIQTITQSLNAIEQPILKAKMIKDNLMNAQNEVSITRKETESEAKRIISNPLFTTKEEKTFAEQFNRVSNQLKNAERTLKDLVPIIEQVESLDEAINVLKPKIDILNEQLNNFSELAGLGLTSEAVSHEFGNISDQLAEKALFYSKKLECGKLDNADIYVLFEYINTTVAGLRTQLRHLDPALKYVRDRKEIFSIYSFFEEQEEYYLNRFKKQNIKYKLNSTEDFYVEMNKGVFTQVIDNIILNSEYWLNDRRRLETNFIPEITILIQRPWVEIFDNGYGVSPNVQESLFEPFVTMKPKSTGRGLGLFIVQQLLDSIGCTINLSPELNEMKRKYIFSVNLSNVLK